MNAFSIQFSPFSLPSCARWHLAPSPPLAASLYGEERWPVLHSPSRAGFAGGGSVGSGLVLVCPAMLQHAPRVACRKPKSAAWHYLCPSCFHGWMRADWSLPRALALWWSLLVQQALGAILSGPVTRLVSGDTREALNTAHSRSLPQN